MLASRMAGAWQILGRHAVEHDLLIESRTLRVLGTRPELLGFESAPSCQPLQRRVGPTAVAIDVVFNVG